MDRVAIKARAKEFAYKNKWNVWKALLLIAAITYAVTFIVGLISGGTATVNADGTTEVSALGGILTLVVSFATMPLQVGLASYMLKLVRGQEVKLTEELFSKYKGEYIWKIILVEFVAGLIIFGLSLLFVIPGIIWAIKYAMMSFVLAEQTSEEMANEKAYKVSQRLMDGHKWEYFVFQLSFIGWYILCGLTLGILYIWIVPYTTVANVMWYEELKKISN